MHPELPIPFIGMNECIHEEYSASMRSTAKKVLPHPGAASSRRTMLVSVPLASRYLGLDKANMRYLKANVTE